jgi:hypothetical protein
MLNDDEFIKVQDHPNLARDRNTGAILDIDATGYERYVAQKQEKHGQRERFSQLEHRINNVESNLSDIKDLLTRLLEK